MSASKNKAAQPAVQIDAEVVRQMRQHARSQSKTEVCGVLIGSELKDTVAIEALIPGLKAAQAGTHVTFTQDTWEHVYKIKDRDYPDQRIVGWYHSHPGFGVFLSDHDTFIHKNFFSAPLQVAWVYDPHSDEEGCFGWAGKRLERLTEIAIIDSKGGEGAGETGKPEPVGERDEAEEADLADRDQEAEPPAWFRWTTKIMSYAALFMVGFLISWFFFPPPPKVLLVPVDPQTGRVLQQSPGDQSGGTPQADGTLPAPNVAPQNPDASHSASPDTRSGEVKNAPKQ
jgi:proteasome lid subunit RPN8/RPN11